MCRILVADGMNKEQIENLKELGFDVIDEYYDGEELGLIGCLIIISLFIIFIWRGVRIAIKAKDTYGKLLAMGIKIDVRKVPTDSPENFDEILKKAKTELK